MIASMNEMRSLFSLVAFGGYIYAIGGEGAPKACQDTIEKYDPSADTWEVLAGVTFSSGARCQAAAIVVGG